MTMNVSIAQAKAQFSELVKRAESGEEVVITRHGKPVVSMAATNVKPENAPSLIGALEGKIWIADDFDELGPEWDEYIK
jgi:antitoxin (DNA-binding transcriptional repressor) of toxin-antitoxin stability system